MLRPIFLATLFRRQLTGAVPTISVAPVISGNKRVTETLTTTDGTWNNTPTGYTYQWYRDGLAIVGATNNTRVLAEADAGAAITCEVVASNASGNSAASASNALTIDVYVVYLGTVSSGTDATTYSGTIWDTFSLGVAADNRHIVVGLIGRSSNTAMAWTSGSVGGVATAIAGSADARNTSSGTGTNFAILTIAAVPTGTTANIITVLSHTVVRFGIGVWAMYGAASATPDTSAASLANDPTSTQTIPAGGSAIGCGYGGGTTTATITGIVEDFDLQVETNAMGIFGGHLNSPAGGSTAMLIDISGVGTSQAGAFATWGP